MGISVHCADCPNVANMEPERLISVHWDGAEEKPYEARIFIIAKNEHGVLADVALVLAKNGVNIIGLDMKNLVDGRAGCALLWKCATLRSCTSLSRPSAPCRPYWKWCAIQRTSDFETGCFF